jgi:hypothetical protein
MQNVTPSVVFVYLLIGLALVSWCLGVLFFVRAVRAAEPGTPWTVRAQPLYLLVKPDAFTAEARQHWRHYFVCMAVFAGCIGIMFLIERLPMPPIR